MSIRSFVLALALFISFSSFAKEIHRQHIECSGPNSIEHFILDINFTTPSKTVMGYVFGIGTPDHYYFKKQAFFEEELSEHYVFSSRKEGQTTKESFYLPKKYYKKGNIPFKMEIVVENLQSNYKRPFLFSCYSSLF